jgi:hypothetical protein
MFGQHRKTQHPHRITPHLEPLEPRSVPALLTANGLWVTGTGNGFEGADTSSVESGYMTYGFTAQANAFHVADDFTVPSGVLAWNLVQVKVFAYQTLSPANQNTFTKLHVKIHKGDPSAGGTLNLDCSGPNAIDVTGTTVFTNTYRVDGVDLQNDDRPVRQITGNLCEPRRLLPGDYWLEWGVEGSGQFAPPRANVTVPWDATDNGKKLVVSTGVWSPMTDPGTQNVHDIPFEIHGRVVPLPMPSPDNELSAESLATSETPSPRREAVKLDFPPQTARTIPPQPGQKLVARSVPAVDEIFADLDWSMH